MCFLPGVLKTTVEKHMPPCFQLLVAQHLSPVPLVLEKTEVQTSKNPTLHSVQLRWAKNMAATGSTLPMTAMTDYMHRHYTSMKEVCQMGDILKHTKPSPCLTCTRVTDPQACENKRCARWRQWFMGRWALIYAYGQLYLHPLDPAASSGSIGMKAPAEDFQQTGADPCDSCICERDMCAAPCRTKRAWLREQEEENR